MVRAQRDEAAELVLQRAVAGERETAELDGILLLGLNVYEVEIVNVAEFLAGQEHRHADGCQQQREHPEYPVQGKRHGRVTLGALLGWMQPGRVEGGADVRYVAGPE